MSTARRLVDASVDTRRTVLRSYFCSDKVFRFDGRPVCVTFLKEGFHYSTVTIAEVSSGKVKRPKYVPKSRASTTNSPQSNSSTDSASNTGSSSSDFHIDAVVKKKKEAIVSFILRVAEDCGDNMPHKKEIHLPFHQVQELLPMFDREFKLLYPNMTAVSKAYFRRIWKLHCPCVKVMRSTRFTVCDICDSLKSQLRETVIKGASTADIKDQRTAHLKFVTAERMEY